jgi:hypothetical protein
MVSCDRRLRWIGDDSFDRSRFKRDDVVRPDGCQLIRVPESVANPIVVTPAPGRGDCVPLWEPDHCRCGAMSGATPPAIAEPGAARLRSMRACSNETDR